MNLNSANRNRAVTYTNCGIDTNEMMKMGKYQISEFRFRLFETPFNHVEGVHIIILHNVFNSINSLYRLDLAPLYRYE